MMELEVVSQVASDLAASEAAHPELIQRHEIVPAGSTEVAQSATQVATDFAAGSEAALSDLAPPSEEDNAEAEEEAGAKPGLFADRE
jgi:hypothetical protein